MLRKLLMVSSPLVLAFASMPAAGDDFVARLQPGQEVPALSSAARGRFKAHVDEESKTISFELSYENLDLAEPPLFAHIHVGQRGANGGVSVFLCGPPENAAQTCPVAPATVVGELTPANIVGPVPQGIDPATDVDNGFHELVALLRSGRTYANVHSSKFPGGELRGQIRAVSR
jgi:CHRD domain